MLETLNLKQKKSYIKFGLFLGLSFIIGLSLLGRVGASPSAAFQPEANQYALNFDGQNDYVQIDYNNFALGQGDFTFEAWVKGLESTQPTHPQILSNRSGHGDGFLFGFHDIWQGSKHKIPYVQIEGINYIDYKNPPNLLDGRWHHFAARRDGQEIAYFADGEQVAKINIIGNPDISTRNPLWIGNDRSTDKTTFNGMISEVRLWQVARSDSQIRANMQEVLRGNEQGLLGYWRLNEGQGQNVIDKVNNHIGQLGQSSSIDANDPEWVRASGAIPESSVQNTPTPISQVNRTPLAQSTNTVPPSNIPNQPDTPDSFYSSLLPLFFIALGVGFSIAVVGISFIALITFQNSSKKQREIWLNLAQANDLQFVPKGFAQDEYFFGTRRGYNLVLEIYRSVIGNNKRTRVIVSHQQPSEKEVILTDEILQKPPLEIKEVVKLLHPLRLNGSSKISASANGQEIRYECDGFESDTAYLQFLFDWLTDIINAYPQIMALGGDIIPTLKTSLERKNGNLAPLIKQIAFDISRETTKRLGNQTSHLLCVNCLTYCKKHSVSLPGNTISYYGCRLCGQSRHFYEATVSMAILDEQSETEVNNQGKICRVNWLIRREVFDFDSIEIVQAADEAVERFAMQVGNDTDPIRRPRYKEMTCTIGPNCALSENTIHILEEVFGKVIRK